MLEPARYDGRNKIGYNGSPKYLNNPAGIPTQTMFKVMHERHPNIEAGCSADGVVLDTFMGGTTALVASELGRNYVGIERNEDYVRLAEDRLQECARVSKKR